MEVVGKKNGAGYNRRAWQRVEILSQDRSVVELDIATTVAHSPLDALTEE
jgi:hypothetical protein